MKIPINLASQPFRRDRAMLVGSVAVSIALLCTLGVLISLANTDTKQLVDVKREVNQLTLQVQKIAAEQTKQDTILRQPQNAEAVERTVFINSLLMRKGISWTRILADMEKVLPYNVRIMQIHPTLTPQNQVLLDMTVACESQPPVIEFFKSLEESQLFGSVVEHSSLPPTQAEPIYKYHVSVMYAQKL